MRTRENLALPSGMDVHFAPIRVVRSSNGIVFFSVQCIFFVLQTDTSDQTSDFSHLRYDILSHSRNVFYYQIDFI